MFYLQRDPADIGRDNRFCLPEGLRNGQAESLLQRLRRITVDARCRALISRSFWDIDRIWISGSPLADSITSSKTFCPSGSSVAVPLASKRRQSLCFFTSR